MQPLDGQSVLSPGNLESSQWETNLLSYLRWAERSNGVRSRIMSGESLSHMPEVTEGQTSRGSWSLQTSTEWTCRNGQSWECPQRERDETGASRGLGTCSSQHQFPRRLTGLVSTRFHCPHNLFGLCRLSAVSTVESQWPLEGTVQLFIS